MKLLIVKGAPQGQNLPRCLGSSPGPATTSCVTLSRPLPSLGPRPPLCARELKATMGPSGIGGHGRHRGVVGTGGYHGDRWVSAWWAQGSVVGTGVRGGHGRHRGGGNRWVSWAWEAQGSVMGTGMRDRHRWA